MNKEAESKEADSKEADYRQNAVETVELANKAATADDKSRLLWLAEKWLDLADRTRRLVGRPMSPVGEHPLVTRVLGDGGREPPTAINN
jgi:hypothetical protein